MAKERFSGLIERKYKRAAKLDTKYSLSGSLALEPSEKDLSVRFLSQHLEKKHVNTIDTIIKSPLGMAFEDSLPLELLEYRNDKRKEMLLEMDEDIAEVTKEQFGRHALLPRILNSAIQDIVDVGIHRDIFGRKPLQSAAKEILFMEGWFAPEKVLVDVWSREWKEKIAEA